MQSIRRRITLGIAIMLATAGTAVGAIGAVGASASTAQNAPYGANTLNAVLVSSQPTNDKGVMQSFVSGFQTAAQQFHFSKSRVVVLTDPSTYVSTLEAVAPQYGLIFATFPPMIQAVSTVAPKFPKTHFVLLDAQIPKPLPNVQTLFFYENQSSYLSGIVAGMMTKTNKVGFLGALVQNVINRYLIGYYFGVKYVNPKAKVCWSYVGNLENPALGKQDALTMYSEGIDIIHAATAGTEVGVYEASEQVKKYLIGADVPIQPYDPVYGLTASGPNFGGAAFDVMQQQAKGTFVAGEHQYGLADGAVRILPFNKIVPNSVRAEVAKVQKLIISRAIKVPGNLGIIPKSMVNC